MAEDTTLTFLGAARTVTGSCMLLGHKGRRIMIDCGLFQGSKTLEARNADAFDLDVAALDAVVLTHAHIDHCGRIPKLVRDGFRGKIWCTEPTRDLLDYTLPDSGRIQEGEAERQSRRNARRGLKPVPPIYTEADALDALEQNALVDYAQWFEPAPGFRVRFWNAGHILGSGSAEVHVGGQRLLFSGDLGPDEKAFHPDPEAPAGFDHIVCESTYGSRDKPDVTIEERRAALLQEVQTALARGGNLVIPAFAIERTQELILDLAQLMNQGKLARTQIFIDSPLAQKATGVFFKHKDLLEGLGDGKIFRHSAIHYVETREQSMQVNNVSGAIIISASGMCNAGRIVHHLKHNLWRAESTVLFVGYQAHGTLGRVILEGKKRVRVAGSDINVRAEIRRIDNYSAHADQKELANWIIERGPVRGTIFLTHGEPDAMDGLRDALAQRGLDHGKVVSGLMGETFALEAGAPARSLGGAEPDAEHADAPDWQNEAADLMAQFQSKLLDIRSTRRREEALGKIRKVLDSYADARG